MAVCSIQVEKSQDSLKGLLATRHQKLFLNDLPSPKQASFNRQKFRLWENKISLFHKNINTEQVRDLLLAKIFADV